VSIGCTSRDPIDKCVNGVLSATKVSALAKDDIEKRSATPSGKLRKRKSQPDFGAALPRPRLDERATHSPATSGTTHGGFVLCLGPGVLGVRCVQLPRRVSSALGSPEDARPGHE
jgi:hypothetical protein